MNNNKLQLPSDITEIVQLALAEDVGAGDITAQLVPETAQATAQVISRQTAVLCGSAWFDEVFRQLEPGIKIDWQVTDGSLVAPNQVLCHLNGPARALLTGERTALNFLQLLSGTATKVHQYVQVIRENQTLKTRILDTRKTIPGLRQAQKYAVRCAGGTNHRMGLYDAFLIKENHIAAAGSLTQAVVKARQVAPHLPVEVEVETLEQVTEALQAQADILLLDNFSLSQLQTAVAMVRNKTKQVKLEASGGMSLEKIKEVAATGVDYISVGAMTKDVQAVDLSLLIVNC
jgi:nicotinate-nucleotide pyrophosphorylase (carboxylating)